MFKKSYFLEGLFARDLVEKQKALKAMVQTRAWGCMHAFKQSASAHTRAQGLVQDQSIKAPPPAADSVRRDHPRTRVAINSELEKFAFTVTAYN